MKKINNFTIIWHYLKPIKRKLYLYILLVFIINLPGFLSGYLWGKAIEFLTIKDFTNFTLYLSLWSGLFILAFSILGRPKDKIFNVLELEFISSVSKDLYHKIDNLPAIAFEDIGVGEFINRMYTDPERVMDLIASLVKLICRSIIVIIIYIVAFKISLLTGIEVIIFSLIMGFISFRFFPRIKESQKEFKKCTDEYVKESTENVTGIREIKYLGIKSNIEKKEFNTIDDLISKNKKIKNYEINYNCLNNLIFFVLEFIIFYTAGHYYFIGLITLAEFIMLETYVWRIDDVVESLSEFGVNFNKVSVSLKRIGEILNNELYQDELYGNVNLNNPKGIIKFNNVSFKYRQEEDNTLNNLNMEIPTNKKIAIVGKSGNGKSTIFNLLLRYFDSTEGSIYIDNTNILDLTEASLRNTISIIRQAPFLFNLSIYDNFKLVKENVTLEEIRNVCKKSYIDDYIMNLPKQYDTIIGEGGINLSGGQKQRLAIARTILLNTKIILFDEATSALDNESQAYIKKTIDELVKDHTIIIVAHRLSTIVDADTINIIDKGKLLATGTHQELLKKCKVYKDLYQTESQETTIE